MFVKSVVIHQYLSKRRTLCISSPVKSTGRSVKTLHFFDKFIGTSETKGKEEFATASLFCPRIFKNFDFLIRLPVS